MHDGLRTMLAEHPIKRGAVVDVDLFEGIAFASGRIGQRLQIAGISKFVDVNDGVNGVTDNVAHQGRANESGPAGNKYFHELVPEATAAAIAKNATVWPLRMGASLPSTRGGETRKHTAPTCVTPESCPRYRDE